MAQQFILASNSPRRKQLLQLFNLPFAVAPADVDESRLPQEHPADYVLRLAESKARAVATTGRVVIAADTIVVDGEEVLGKPAHAADAQRMLQQLRGRQHQVLTALAVIDCVSNRLVLDCCTTDVVMRTYSDEDVQAYITSGDPFDKAGAYAIQNRSFAPVAGIKGCFASVMGFPLCHLVHCLARLHHNTQPDIPTACQQTLAHDCQVFNACLHAQPLSINPWLPDGA